MADLLRGGRARARKIETSFSGGNVAPRPPRLAPYPVFAATAVSMPVEVPHKRPMVEQPLEQTPELAAPQTEHDHLEQQQGGGCAEEPRAAGNDPRGIDEVRAGDAEEPPKWDWVEEALRRQHAAAAAQCQSVEPRAGETTSSHSASDARKDSEVASQLDPKWGRPSNESDMAAAAAAARADAHHVEQMILRASDAPQLELLDDELLTDEELRRLQRQVHSLTAEEQEHRARIAPFIAKEIELEDARFRAEQWAAVVIFGSSAAVLRAAIHRNYAGRSIAQVVAPHLRFRLARWHRTASRQVTNRELGASVTKPTARCLREVGNNNFFADWPLSALSRLIGVMGVTAFRRGECVYHEGDLSDDVFFVADGAVDLVVRTGRSEARPKSRRHENGIVVAQRHNGDMFGVAPHFLREPREATAICVAEPTVCFTVSRAEFVLAASVLPQLTHECLRRRVLDELAALVRTAFPLTPAALQRCTVFSGWHIAALVELADAFAPCVRLRGETLFDVGAPDAAAFFVVSGAVDVEVHIDGGSAVVAERCGSGDCIGTDNVVFGDLARERAVCAQTCRLYVLSRAAYLPVAMANAQCAVATRRVANECRAARLARPGECAALAADHTLRYLLPPGVVSALWASAAPVVLSQGDAVCVEGAPLRALLVVVSGTLYARRPELAEHGLPPLQRHIIVSEEPHRGFVVGALELGLGTSAHLAALRCTSECVAWRMPLSTLTALLAREHPDVAVAIASEHTSRTVAAHLSAGTLELLEGESVPPCRAGCRLGVLPHTRL